MSGGGHSHSGGNANTFTNRLHSARSGRNNNLVGTPDTQRSVVRGGGGILPNDNGSMAGSVARRTHGVFTPTRLGAQSASHSNVGTPQN